MSAKPKPDAPKPWVAAIHRLLRAELRPDPRAKPGKTPAQIYWNGQDLAVAANIRPNTLSDAMTGKREPSVSTLMAIATALHVPVASLLMEVEEAETYVRFRQNQHLSAQSVATEEAVRRVLEQQADKMKEAWIATQTQTVLQALTSASVSHGVPASQPAATTGSTQGHDSPAVDPTAREGLQRHRRHA